MKVVTAFIIFLGVATAKLGNFTLSADLKNAIRGHLTTCTACEIATGVVQDEAAMKHVKLLLQGYCNEVPPDSQKLFQEAANRIFENGLEIAQHYTFKTNCEAFCGANSQQFSTKTFCSGITAVLDNIVTILDTFELKVESVCTSEIDPNECISQLQKWRFLITDFLKRSMLRIVKEIESKTLCNIDSDAALKMPNFYPHLSRGTTPAICTVCENVVETGCEMLTNPQVYTSYLFAESLISECQKITSCPSVCGADDFVNTIMAFIFPLANFYVWPQACHFIDERCPVNPNSMCTSNN